MRVTFHALAHPAISPGLSRSGDGMRGRSLDTIEYLREVPVQIRIKIHELTPALEKQVQANLGNPSTTPQRR